MGGGADIAPPRDLFPVSSPAFVDNGNCRGESGTATEY